jgi:hypothetical protein
MMKQCTQVKSGFFAQISAINQAVRPTVEAIDRSMCRITTTGVMPIAKSATTDVDVRRSLVPSPVKNRGLIKPVTPMAINKIMPRLASRLDGFNLFNRSII